MLFRSRLFLLAKFCQPQLRIDCKKKRTINFGKSSRALYAPSARTNVNRVCCVPTVYAGQKTLRRALKGFISSRLKPTNNVHLDQKGRGMLAEIYDAIDQFETPAK